MNKLKSKKGQVTLEMTTSLIVLLILIAGIIRVFVWVNDCMLERQEAYEGTRIVAGGGASYDQELIDMKQKLSDMEKEFYYGYYDEEKAKEYLELKEAISRREGAEGKNLILVDESTLPKLDILGDNK